jgi:hypothetical protein
VVAVALGAGVVVAADAVRAELDTGTDCSVTSARTESAAFDLAELCDKDIEIESLRTEYDTFWATPRQTVRADASSSAVRTNLAGHWQETDPTVTVDESGTPRVAAPVFDMSLAGATASREDAPFATMRADQLTLSMGLPDGLGLGDPVVDPAHAARVVYPVKDPVGAVIAGADLVLTIHPDATGFTPVLRIADSVAGEALVDAAGADGLGFEVGVSGGLVLTDVAPEIEGMAPDPAPEDGSPEGGPEEPADGVETARTRTAADVGSSGEGFYAVDPAGGLTFTGAPALQWDSDIAGATARSATSENIDPAATATAALDPVDGPDPRARVVALDAEIAADGASAVIRADEAMATDPDGVFPVFVDPAVSGSLHSRTAIKKAWPTSSSSWNFTGSAGMGYCDYGRDASCLRSGNVWRPIWKFTGMSILPDLRPDDVVKAAFRVYGTHSWSCSTTVMRLYRVNSINSTTSWNNTGGWGDANMVGAVRDSYYDSSCGGSHWTEWNATSVARYMVNNNLTGINLGLRAADESNYETWKKIRYDARFSVEYNRPPAMPSGHQTLVDGANVGCSTDASAPKTSRWSRPYLSAIGKDPESQQVQMQFRVLTAGSNTTVWESGWTSWQSPGSTGVRLSKRVTEGDELSNGTTYWWQARIQDRGGLVTGYANSKHCYFRVDISAPAEPRITPLRDHPDAEAFYESGKERGGVNLTGCFEIYAPSTDSTTIWWGYATRTNTHKVALDSTRRTTVCVAPGSTGPKFLYAKVADKANLTSDAEYEFDVAAAREDGVWTFDNAEGRGEDTAEFDADRNEFLSAGKLNLSSASDSLFEPGPHEEFGARDGDDALVARDTNIAWTDAPVVDTTKSFVVSAHVKLDADSARTGWYAALSQEGPLYNGFWLGYRPNSCPTSDDVCWAFAVNRNLGSNSPTYARSAVPVKFGQWVHLLGEYDKPEGKLRLYVCDAGTPDDPAVGEPVLTESAMTASLPAAPGRFVVGRGFVGGSPANYWNGHIDNVRIFRGEVLAQAKIRRLCQGAEASSYVGGNGVDDVDPTWGDDAGENEVGQ